MTTTCPRCQSERIVTGELRASEGQPAFYPQPTRTRWFSLFWKPSVVVEEWSKVCLDCGLFWSRVDPQRIQELHSKYGL